MCVCVYVSIHSFIHSTMRARSKASECQLSVPSPDRTSCSCCSLRGPCRCNGKKCVRAESKRVIHRLDSLLVLLVIRRTDRQGQGQGHREGSARQATPTLPPASPPMARLSLASLIVAALLSSHARGALAKHRVIIISDIVLDPHNPGADPVRRRAI